MVETYVFGHKSPDSDSITSSLVMTNLEHELGNADAKAYRLGNINKETEFILNYLGMEATELLEGVEDGGAVRGVQLCHSVGAPRHSEGVRGGRGGA